MSDRNAESEVEGRNVTTQRAPEAAVVEYGHAGDLIGKNPEAVDAILDFDRTAVLRYVGRQHGRQCRFTGEDLAFEQACVESGEIRHGGDQASAAVQVDRWTPAGGVLAT